MTRSNEPTYIELFEQLRRTHPWPQEPNVFGDEMHALALARSAENETANRYGDKARDWAIATWRDTRKERRPLTITDNRSMNWIYAQDRSGQEWAIRGDVYAAIHRREHERVMQAEGLRHMTMGRMEEINRAVDARGVHTSIQGIYPVLIDPETRERRILSTIFDDQPPS